MRMKKNAIALSVATLVTGLGFAGAASAAVIQTTTSRTINGTAVAPAMALRVNAGGVGHSLLQPYFTTQTGGVTLMSVVNTDTVNGKAVKVRFRGASNSDDLFDFQLFLSPGDVWTANVSQGADGRSVLSTTDRSCTLPDSVRSNAAGTPFVLDRLPSFLDAAGRAGQSREGYVEIFNMADIPPLTVTNPVTGQLENSALYTTIKHVGGTPPCAASTLAILGTDLTGSPSATPPITPEAQARSRGLFAPSTGLFGNYILVNQSTAATSWSNEMTSILAITSSAENAPAGLGNIVFFPQTSEFLTDPDAVTADPLLRNSYGAIVNGTFTVSSAPNSGLQPGPLLTPLQFDAPDMSTPYLSNNVGNPQNQARDLSRALATRSIRNEFVTTASIDARTDWTLSFPTRRYSVAVNYAGSQRVFSLADLEHFSPSNTALLTNTAGVPQICVGTRGNSNSSAGDLRLFDREETTMSGGFVISPGTAQTFRFCGEVSVLSFNRVGGTTASGALRAQIAQQSVAAPYTEGWGFLDTSGIGNGLPLLGKAYLQATNPANGGFSTNFGAAYEHRYQRVVPAVTP